jgi:hypothetical protein
MTIPAEALLTQQVKITRAIELLQGSYNMTSVVNPNDATWADVMRFAHVADLANEIISRYEEQ